MRRNKNMDKEIYEDLFKNVVINGHYPFEKLNEMKNYIKTLNIKIDDLEQQCKKQKEVIDKAIEFSNKNWGTWCSNHFVYMTELQNILKEVSE